MVSQNPSINPSLTAVAAVVRRITARRAKTAKHMNRPMHSSQRPQAAHCQLLGAMGGTHLMRSLLCVSRAPTRKPEAQKSCEARVSTIFLGGKQTTVNFAFQPRRKASRATSKLCLSAGGCSAAAVQSFIRAGSTGQDRTLPAACFTRTARGMYRATSAD